MILLQAALLGIIQGLTEFIPISSSAHLIIVPWLFRWDDPALESLPFDVALHLGTLISVLWYFYGDWVRLIRAGWQSLIERRVTGYPDRLLAWMIVVGSVPGGIVGALFESRIEEWFHPTTGEILPGAMLIMALLIALLGLALFVAERLARHVRTLEEAGWRDAILIGLAQAAAVFPGVSRSGATLTAGLALGLRRQDAARFSFLLSAPIILGAGARNVYKVLEQLRQGLLGLGEIQLFVIGFVMAALTGYLAIRFLLRYLAHNSTDLFVYYRWALALLLGIVALTRF